MFKIEFVKLKNPCSAPRLQYMSYCWPMFRNFAKRNIPWAAHWLQNVTGPVFTRWLYCSASPAKLNHLKNFIVPIKINSWSDCSLFKESESFLNPQDESLKFNTSWNHGVHKASDFSFTLVILGHDLDVCCLEAYWLLVLMNWTDAKGQDLGW